MVSLMKVLFIGGDDVLCAFELDNLNIIIDKNGYQQTGTNDEILRMFDLENKFKIFRLHTKSIDGHSISEIYDTLKKFKDIKKQLKFIANTIKGKGFSDLKMIMRGTIKF